MEPTKFARTAELENIIKELHPCNRFYIGYTKKQHKAVMAYIKTTHPKSKDWEKEAHWNSQPQAEARYYVQLSSSSDNKSESSLISCYKDVDPRCLNDINSDKDDTQQGYVYLIVYHFCHGITKQKLYELVARERAKDPLKHLPFGLCEHFIRLCEFREKSEELKSIAAMLGKIDQMKPYHRYCVGISDMFSLDIFGDGVSRKTDWSVKTHSESKPPSRQAYYVQLSDDERYDELQKKCRGDVEKCVHFTEETGSNDSAVLKQDFVYLFQYNFFEGWTKEDCEEEIKTLDLDLAKKLENQKSNNLEIIDKLTPMVNNILEYIGEDEYLQSVESLLERTSKLWIDFSTATSRYQHLIAFKKDTFDESSS